MKRSCVGIVTLALTAMTGISSVSAQVGQNSPPILDVGPVSFIEFEEAPAPLSIRAGYLWWWTRGQSLPPLVTTSPNGTPQASAGVLGAPGTQTLFGGERVNDESRSGGRFSVIFWSDPEQSLGVETDFLFLAGNTTRFNAASTGDPILGRPFFNALTGMQDSVLTAYPGLVTGSLNIESKTSTLYGGELNLRSNMVRSENRRLDLLAGYRCLCISDSVTIRDTEIDAITLDRLDVLDRFRSDSRFHGGQIGAVAEWYRGRYYLECAGKIALGGTCASVDIEGATRVNGAPPVPGGVLALQSNIGHYRSSRLAVLPEFTVNAGCHVTPGLRVFAGYTFLYLSSVARAAEQINTTINSNLLPPVIPGGPSQPAFQFHHTDFWVHGIQLGMELRF